MRFDASLLVSVCYKSTVACVVFFVPSILAHVDVPLGVFVTRATQEVGVTKFVMFM